MSLEWKAFYNSLPQSILCESDSIMDKMDPNNDNWKILKVMIFWFTSGRISIWIFLHKIWLHQKLCQWNDSTALKQSIVKINWRKIPCLPAWAFLKVLSNTIGSLCKHDVWIKIILHDWADLWITQICYHWLFTSNFYLRTHFCYEVLKSD